MNRKHFRCISIGLLHVLLLVLLMLYVCVVYIFSFYLSRWIKFITVAWTERNLRSFSRDSACAVEAVSTAATTAHRRQRAATGTSEILSVQRTYTHTPRLDYYNTLHTSSSRSQNGCVHIERLCFVTTYKGSWWVSWKRRLWVCCGEDALWNLRNFVPFMSSLVAP